jgi:hypothetical protein
MVERLAQNERNLKSGVFTPFSGRIFDTIRDIRKFPAETGYPGRYFFSSALEGFPPGTRSN